MSAPNRSQEVAALVASPACQVLFGSEDGRREILVILCTELNRVDNGNWGRLEKRDRNPPFIPADVLVWKPTREHFDVLTDTGPMWDPKGVLDNPQWVWVAAGGEPLPVPEPPNPPSPPDVPAPPSSDLEARLAALEHTVAINHARMEAINTAFVAADAQNVKQPLPEYVGRAPLFGGTVISRPRP